MRRRLKPGTRVRLKPGVHTFSGWRGTATILEPEGRAIKDGSSDFWGHVDALPEQWAVMRDQTPNPEHAEALRRYERGAW